MYKLEPLTEEERKLIESTLTWDYCEELSEIAGKCFGWSGAEIIPHKAIKCKDGGYLMMVPDSDPENFEPTWYEFRLNPKDGNFFATSAYESLEYVLTHY